MSRPAENGETSRESVVLIYPNPITYFDIRAHAMPGDDLLKHFFGGFVRLHILHHAVLEPIYGVAMIEELGRHGYKLSPGTLYPILHDLAESGYLTHQDEVVDGKRRKTYRATKRGEKLLRDGREKLRELFREVVEEAPPH